MLWLQAGVFPTYPPSFFCWTHCTASPVLPVALLSTQTPLSKSFTQRSARECIVCLLSRRSSETVAGQNVHNGCSLMMIEGRTGERVSIWCAVTSAQELLQVKSSLWEHGLQNSPRRMYIHILPCIPTLQVGACVLLLGHTKDGVKVAYISD